MHSLSTSVMGQKGRGSRWPVTAFEPGPSSWWPCSGRCLGPVHLRRSHILGAGWKEPQGHLLSALDPTGPVNSCANSSSSGSCKQQAAVALGTQHLPPLGIWSFPKIQRSPGPIGYQLLPPPPPRAAIREISWGAKGRPRLTVCVGHTATPSRPPEQEAIFLPPSPPSPRRCAKQGVP